MIDGMIFYKLCIQTKIVDGNIDKLFY